MGKDRTAREEARRDRLGPEDRCVLCGESDTRCLERHHIAGQQFGNDLIVLCRNCHRKLSDDQEDHPGPSSADPPLLERLGQWLLGLADFFHDLADQMTYWAQLLLGVSTDPQDETGGDPA